MLPASNKGVGMSMGFPDVCLTPAVPSARPNPVSEHGHERHGLEVLLRRPL